MYKVLTIAGSDSSGGAGIQADIKTITVHGMYALSAVTALTAQNTTGVFSVHVPPATFIAAQLDAIFTDIPPDAVKIGMVAAAPIIETIAERLTFYRAKNIVVDPVMVATSGDRLLEQDAVSALLEKFLPLATVITPNIPEAKILAAEKADGETPISTPDDMLKAAKAIGEKFSAAILIKGGHLSDKANDLLWQDGKAEWFSGEKIRSSSTHGTGCTLSSAIACHLAAGKSVSQAVKAAKAYVTAAIRQAPGFGQGHGPLNHLADREK